MVEIILDGRLMTDRAAAHDLLAEKLSFPDYYGRNLDALYDLLSAYPKQVHVAVTHDSLILQNLGNYGKALLRTLQDGASANTNVKLSISDEIF